MNQKTYFFISRKLFNEIQLITRGKKKSEIVKIFSWSRLQGYSLQHGKIVSAKRTFADISTYIFQISVFERQLNSILEEFVE